MRTYKEIKKYSILSGSSILKALDKITENQSNIVFITDIKRRLIGSLSDGDIRRWMLQEKNVDMAQSVDAIMNKDYISASVNSSQKHLNSLLDQGFQLIPVTDTSNKLLHVISNSESSFKIGNYKLTSDSPAFIIAEIGNNHQGDLIFARELVDLAVGAGANCIKFQMRNMKSLYKIEDKVQNASFDLGSQYTLDLLNKFQLQPKELCEIFNYCKSLNVIPLCTPWDQRSVDILEEYGIDGYKVASADLTNFKLLKTLALTQKSLIISTGMSTELEIISAIELLKSYDAQFALLHCNSTYPAPYKDINLSYIKRLKEISNNYVGYSGHERGISVPIAAVAIGAKIIEKHFTSDKTLEGIDHKISLLPDEFSEMVKNIRIIEKSMGNSNERKITQGELINRENLAKSLISKVSINKGDIIESKMIDIRSPGQGLQPNRIKELIGKSSKRNMIKGDFFFETDITQTVEKKVKYSFPLRYGIPVRFHDYNNLTKNMDLDLVEFHLSYSDLELDLKTYFDGKSKRELVVHCPELFAKDHLLDLVSSNEDYLRQSITQIEKTILKTKELKKYFPITNKPIFVVNTGGWSTNNFLPKTIRPEMYKNLFSTLKTIDLSEVQLAIQTMPPFPWHFGGQNYHNLFVDPHEIKKFCMETNFKICLDVSHSMMACNYYNWDFKNFLDLVLPFTIHLHIADAEGVDGEGVQIGKGDIDFYELGDILNKSLTKPSFIPEIWQGHKNNGNGFWEALDFLEQRIGSRVVRTK